MLGLFDERADGVPGPYLTSIAKSAADAEGFVHPLGIPVRAGSLFAYAVSASVIVAVILMPIVGAAADRSGRKKPLLAAAAYTGAAARPGCSSWTATAICWARCC